MELFNQIIFQIILFSSLISLIVSGYEGNPTNTFTTDISTTNSISDTDSSTIDITDNDSSTTDISANDISTIDISTNDTNNATQSNSLEDANCFLTQPMRNIKDDCYENIINRKRCCYLEVKFEYNTYIGCIPIDIESVNIKEEINGLKAGLYINSKSIKIDCNNSFIKISFIFAILIFII